MLPSVGTWMVPSFRAPPVPALSCQHCMVSDDPCTCSGLSLHRLEPIFVHAFYRLCSLVFSPAQKQDCSHNLSRIKLLNSESRYLWLILCLPCDDFVRCCYTSFWYPLPWSNNFAAFFAWTHTCNMKVGCRSLLRSVLDMFGT